MPCPGELRLLGIFDIAMEARCLGIPNARQPYKYII
jgi:hypothetical protein